MHRRDFLTGLPGLATMPLMLPQAALAAQSARLKITDVRLIRIKLIEDKGILARRVDTPRGGLHVQIGNFTVTEVHGPNMMAVIIQFLLVKLCQLPRLMAMRLPFSKGNLANMTTNNGKQQARPIGSKANC